jgi:hypothetical protein
LEENYEPFRQGVRKYIPLDKRFDERGAEYLRTIFSDPDKNGKKLAVPGCRSLNRQFRLRTSRL